MFHYVLRTTLLLFTLCGTIMAVHQPHDVKWDTTLPRPDVEINLIERMATLLYDRLGVLQTGTWITSNSGASMINEIFDFPNNNTLLDELKAKAGQFRTGMEAVGTRNAIKLFLPDMGQIHADCEPGVCGFAKLREREITLCPLNSDFDLPFLMPSPGHMTVFEVYAHEMAHVALNSKHFFDADGPDFWTIPKVKTLARINPNAPRPNTIDRVEWRKLKRHRKGIYDAYTWELLFTYSQTTWKFYQPFFGVYLTETTPVTDVAQAKAFQPTFPPSPANQTEEGYRNQVMSLNSYILGNKYTLEPIGDSFLMNSNDPTTPYLSVYGSAQHSPPVYFTKLDNHYRSHKRMVWKGIWDPNWSIADWTFDARVFRTGFSDTSDGVRPGTATNRFQLVQWNNYIAIQNQANRGLVADNNPDTALTFGADSKVTFFASTEVLCPVAFTLFRCVTLRLGNSNDRYLTFTAGAGGAAGTWTTPRVNNPSLAPIWLFTRFRAQRNP